MRASKLIINNSAIFCTIKSPNPNITILFQLSNHLIILIDSNIPNNGHNQINRNFGFLHILINILGLKLMDLFEVC